MGAETNQYTCLRCGSVRGEPGVTVGTENWYWRTFPHGRVGPFCALICSRSFRMDEVPSFTLEEWERLRFLKMHVFVEIEP